MKSLVPFERLVALGRPVPPERSVPPDLVVSSGRLARVGRPARLGRLAALGRAVPVGLLVLACVLVAPSGCASLPSVRPEPPRVTIAGVRPLNLSLTKQRLEFRLRVENPNAYELPLRSLDFVAHLAGDRIASGRSDERVTIPANGEAFVSVDVVAGVGTLIDRMRAMLEERTLELDYEVSGSVRLDNWPRRIPFDVGGVLENPRAEDDERRDDGRRDDERQDDERHDDGADPLGGDG